VTFKDLLTAGRVQWKPSLDFMLDNDKLTNGDVIEFNKLTIPGTGHGLVQVEKYLSGDSFDVWKLDCFAEPPRLGEEVRFTGEFFIVKRGRSYSITDLCPNE